MTFVPLALSKDTTHLYTAGCRVTMWKKRLCLRKRRPSDQNQVVLATPQLELQSFHLHTQQVVFEKRKDRE